MKKEIKAGTLIDRCGVIYKVIEKCKTTIIIDDKGNKIVDIRKYGLVGYRCINTKTNTICVVPISLVEETKIINESKKDK